VALAETSRIPVDNRETHLELTMIHEAMVLEYSGRNLAMIELASHIRQIVFLTLIANVALPTARGFYALKLLALAGIIAVVEVSTAKIRLFRVVDLLRSGSCFQPCRHNVGHGKVNGFFYFQYPRDDVFRRCL